MTGQTQQEQDKQKREEIAGEIVKRAVQLKNVGVEIFTQLPAPTIMKIGKEIVSLTVDTTTADPLTPKGKLAFEIGGAAIGTAIGGGVATGAISFFFGTPAIFTKGGIAAIVAASEGVGQAGEIIFGSIYDELPESYKARIEDYFNNGFSELPSDIYEVFEDAAAALAESINEAINEFADTISNVVEETQEYIEQKAKEIYDYVVEKYGELQDLTRQAIDALKNAWDGFIENISSFYDLFMEFLEELFGGEAPQEAKAQTPVIFDMDGDGIELVSLSSSRVYFDIDNDGFKEKTAWVAPDDALLAFDRNANGVIDNQNELFGRRPSDGTLANRDGFDILQTEFDSNNDSLITSADTNFNSLRVWNDLNGDGISQANELRTLAQAGITRINLNENNFPSEIFLGKRAVEKSDFTINGVVRNAFDLLFDVNQTASEYILPANYQYAAGVTSLPSLRGIGDVKPLWVAMTDDTALRNMVQTFNNQNYSNVNFGQLRTTVENILYQWTGTTNIANSGKHLSSRIVETMDRWFGLDTDNVDFNQNISA